MKELDRAKGVVFGLAIGDALGWPTEFMTAATSLIMIVFLIKIG
jgi:ADP-ribosylglycohydrolase